jgi:hypothetical protein
MEAILAKLKQIQENPGYFKGLTPEEQAELFLALLTPKKKILRKPVVITGIDGKTPEKDKDYLSKESSLAILNEIKDDVQKTLKNIKPLKGEKGEDAEITSELIEEIISEAVARIPIPKFPIEVTKMVLDSQDEIIFIKEELGRLEEELKKEQKPYIFGGGISKNTVAKMIQDTQSFETVSKNLKSIDATYNYTGDNLTSIVYNNGITKTLNYTGDNLTSVVLSGATPSGIDLTKTFNYTGENITSKTYT